MTQRNTEQTLAWLRNQHDIGSTAWRAKCLQATRTARNLPAVYPSALAAQHATPMSDRVYDRDQWVPGMVVFIDDPDDSNPFGHVVTLRTGPKASSPLLTWTNDAFVSGGISCVDVDWFERHWGDKVQFASRSLNGFALDLPEMTAPKHPRPKPPLRASAVNLEYAIHRLEKAIAFHQEKGHTRLVKALRADVAEIRETIKRFS